MHGKPRLNNLMLKAFFRLMDGLIFLSQNSPELAFVSYPDFVGKPFLVTHHGHYDGLIETAPTPRRQLKRRAPLIIFFGPYSPIQKYQTLVEIVAGLPGVTLTDAGRIEWPPRSAPRQLGIRTSKLDMREAVLPDDELKKLLGSADAVTVIYRNILNSGSVMFSLFRNRPVLAPHTGSLPELQEDAGNERLNLCTSLRALQCDKLIVLCTTGGI